MAKVEQEQNRNVVLTKNYFKHDRANPRKPGGQCEGWDFFSRKQLKKLFQ